MAKVALIDKRVFKKFLEVSSGISATLSVAVLFYDIPAEAKELAGWAFVSFLLIVYLYIWIWANTLNAVDIDVEGSRVTVKVGDIFAQPGLKAIAFNEYFDTLVDNKVISESSVNGMYIKNHLVTTVAALDAYIDGYAFRQEEVLSVNQGRTTGKKQRFQLGTICLFQDYLLTAFAKFDDKNQAVLTMPEYLEFLINFWDRVNSIYAQKSVTTTIFGSGITRIKGHKTIADEDLLKIMLWTFRISEMRFKYPAKLTILVHKDKIDQINLLDIKSTRNGV